MSVAIVIRDSAGHQAATLTSAADGTFQVSVPAGVYTVTGTLGPPRSSTRSATVTVSAGTVVPVHLVFDTGVR
ncbi:MAG: hypothetical protein ABR564_10150 [Candidatus Dormibacteria bacterium]